jgi:hypothetical protein
MMRGVSFGDWVRALWDNGFRVPPAYWPKAAWTTLQGLGNSPLRWLEAALFARRLAAVEVPPPLFVLGHARSGTTHLHRLLAAGDRFACPTLSQVWHPHDFLLLDGIRSKVYRRFLTATRVVDNVAWDPQAPSEDELALCRATLLSPVMGQVFPRRAAYCERYLTFRGVPPREVERWKAAFGRLARKWTWKYRRPLLLKSPEHTARIRLLLEMFPGAKFVHIHRNPYVVYQSTKRLRLLLSEHFPFQRPDPAEHHPRILRYYSAMYDAFFEERGQVPAGHYSEVGFEELEKEPVGQVRRVYAELGLPDFEAARPALEAYVASLAGYRKNEHPQLAPDVRADVARAWRRCFDEWQYAP